MFKFIFLFLLSFNAYAFDEWSEADKTREAVYIAVDAIDWLQTRNISRMSRGEMKCYEADKNCHETNPLIGERPSIGRVNGFFASALLVHVLTVTLLPSEYRPTFQIGSIIYEFSYVAGNYQLGISSKF